MHNHPANGRGIKNAAIRLSVRLSVCLFHAHSTKMVHFMAMVRPIIEHQEDTSCWKSNPLVSIATESSQNGNEAVAGAASEAFARWLALAAPQICPRKTAIGEHTVSSADTL